MSNKPRVTICMCAYMHARYIRQALDALAAQTYPHFKIIACDDGSTDGTYEILKEYESGKLAGKLTVITHPGHVNRGIYHTYNACLDYVDTEFFRGHASDDFWDPDALEYWVSFMDEHPDADFTYGICKVVDDKGELLPRYFGHHDIGAGAVALEQFVYNNPLAEPSMFYRSCCVSFKRKADGLAYADWYHGALLVKHLQPLPYRCPKVNYRWHQKSTWQYAGGVKHFKRLLLLMQAMLDDGLYDDVNKALMLLHVRVFSLHSALGDVESARRAWGFILCRFGRDPCFIDAEVWCKFLNYHKRIDWGIPAYLLTLLPVRVARSVARAYSYKDMMTHYVESRAYIDVMKTAKLFYVLATVFSLTAASNYLLVSGMRYIRLFCNSSINTRLHG